jgi:hypothetical protein
VSEGLHLTPEILRAAYDYLRATPPFNRWKLPPADEVEFHVTRHKDRTGDCETGPAGQEPIIRISATLVGWTSSLMATMAHELIHVYLDRKGVRAHHGAAFRRCAAQVCRRHGFDPKLF